MSREIKGYSIQNEIPTPDNPVEIKNIIKELLFIPRNELIKLLISQQQENKHLKELQRNMDKQYAELENNWNELKEMLAKNVRDAKSGSSLSYYFMEVLMFMEELESGKNERSK